MASKLEGHKHLISVRALRLKRPTFVGLSVPPAEVRLDEYAGWLSHDLFYHRLHGMPLGDTSLSQVSSLAMGELSDIISLPQAFGSLFLGETFYCYINLHNESNTIVRNLQMKAIVHQGENVTILPTVGSTVGQLHLSSSSLSWEPEDSPGSSGVTLNPHTSLNFVIHHEMKELGEHTLSCGVKYTVRSPLSSSNVIDDNASKDQEQVFNISKNFKFKAEKPLDVKTQLVQEHFGTIIEAGVQNLMQHPIFLERVSLEPGPQFRAIDLNKALFKESVFEDGLGEGLTSGLFMRAGDVVRLLYSTQPRLGSAGAFAEPRSLFLGHLDITWRSYMGEKGHLQTGPITLASVPLPDLSLSVLTVPVEVELEKPFRVVCQLTNNTCRPLDLQLSLPPPIEKANEPSSFPSAAFIWLGPITRRLAPLTPGSTSQLHLDVLPVQSGLQELSGIQLRMLSSEKEFIFNDLARLHVVSATPV